VGKGKDVATVAAASLFSHPLSLFLFFLPLCARRWAAKKAPFYFFISMEGGADSGFFSSYSDFLPLPFSFIGPRKGIGKRTVVFPQSFFSLSLPFPPLFPPLSS